MPLNEEVIFENVLLVVVKMKNGTMKVVNIKFSLICEIVKFFLICHTSHNFRFSHILTPLLILINNFSDLGDNLSFILRIIKNSKDSIIIKFILYLL